MCDVIISNFLSRKRVTVGFLSSVLASSVESSKRSVFRAYAPLPDLCCKTAEQSIKITTDQSDLPTIKAFVGIDSGDPVLAKSTHDDDDDDIIARVFGDAEIPFETIICEEPRQEGSTDDVGSGGPLPAKGQVCRVWRMLASSAFRQGAQYTVLLGDDVRLLSTDWTSEIRREFADLHRLAFPFDGGPTEGSPPTDVPPVGFGVLCFTDVSSPGFPGFPVLHQTHREIFTEIFPPEFVNQDADPWIFEVWTDALPSAVRIILWIL